MSVTTTTRKHFKKSTIASLTTTKESSSGSTCVCTCTDSATPVQPTSDYIPVTTHMPVKTTRERITRKLSCHDSCAKRSPCGGCWCDDVCDQYNNCCPDYEQWCVNTQMPFLVF